jgi:acyl-CoA synthetase (AMP-forming)/AMP-acid ligase II
MSDWFPAALREHGDRVALLTEDGSFTYAELAGQVSAAAEQLGFRRRLVALAARNDSGSIATYLAALAGHHPLILVDGDNADGLRRIVDRYDPDVVVASGSHPEIDERRHGSRHELHPDLALLLSTSGSTGSPKLVRLSRRNIQANAESIAAYLDLTDRDRAITTLPMAYCYGLSVINSHLNRGASVVLTDRSVIDPEFWELLRRTRATSFAGVPYTFDLLDRIGFADMELPDLRYLTQAGGRLDPAHVRAYATLGERRGWDLYVMYGQTEATARMAYLPPALAATRPESIGIPIPGGSMRIEPVPGAADGTGELVYRGPNVMLGYANGPADLALGRTTDELRTGDLGRRADDGTFEITGRRTTFIKIAGLRMDPGGIERLLESRGVRAGVAGTDDELVLVIEHATEADPGRLVRETVCLPAHAVRVVAVPELPRLPNGKLDRPTIQALAAPEGGAHANATGDRPAAVRELYATALSCEVTGADSFSSLGGDSLSYIEVTLGLEEILGRVPDRWETMSVDALAALASPRTDNRRWWQLGRWRSVEMSVALRATAIVLIVATHIGMVSLPGGAHVLMAVAGFNFGRFRLGETSRAERLRAQLRAVARIAIPAMVWVAFAMAVLGEYELRHLLLVNALVRDELWGNLWFIELLVYIGLGMAALMAVPAFDRAERRSPFAVALAMVGIGLLFRFGIVDFGIPYTMPVLWLFAIGWATSRAGQPWQRALVAAIALLSVPGYFDGWERNAAILVGVLLLVGIPHVRVPDALARAGGVLAGASLTIYLVHWEVWPLFEGWYGVPSLVGSLAAGIALWLLVSRAGGLASALWRRITDREVVGTLLPRSLTAGRPR